MRFRIIGIVALVFLGFVALLWLVRALGLEDGSRNCARGSCASGTAIYAAMILTFGWFLIGIPLSKGWEFAMEVRARRLAARRAATDPVFNEVLAGADIRKLSREGIDALNKKAAEARIRKRIKELENSHRRG